MFGMSAPSSQMTTQLADWNRYSLGLGSVSCCISMSCIVLLPGAAHTSSRGLGSKAPASPEAAMGAMKRSLSSCCRISRQLTAVHRVNRPARPEKARHHGFRSKQGRGLGSKAPASPEAAMGAMKRSLSSCCRISRSLP
ncbi:hypothetical protein PRIPAC_86073 [Pristionchus pacificus]|uniref:Ribosomal protein L15 n=1 Tax=Pristionchus pacificus TaxID=54126 RepID=A0A2A6CER4_PRIPA|nr:hypothetical protein PRIPAC_86073 [Pristionchus pacificus]|eukprot:PDM76543.1 ribosomal protein [Pristionchus pacificus]